MVYIYDNSRWFPACVPIHVWIFCLGLHGFAVSNLAGVMLYSVVLEISVWTQCFLQSHKPHGKGYFRYFRILRLVSCCTVLLTAFSFKRAEVFSGWHLLRNPVCATKHVIKSSSRWHTWHAPKHKQRPNVVPTKVSVPLPTKNKCLTVSNGGHFGLIEIVDMASISPQLWKVFTKLFNMKSFIHDANQPNTGVICFYWTPSVLINAPRVCWLHGFI